MASRSQSKSGGDRSVPLFAGFLACLLLVLAGLFFLSFSPNEVIFSNDNPLGAISSAWYQPPTAFFGMWEDMNVFGFSAGSLPFSLTYVALWFLKAVLYSKFYVPLAIAFVGCSAWLCFRRLGLSPTACFLGGLAASLNSGFVSAACWGVIPQTVAFGMNFLAVAALAGEPRRPWLSFILAGMAVGLNVMEAADIGALFSLLIAAYVLYESIQSSDSLKQGLVRGVARTAVVAFFAMLIAAQAIYALVTTQIQGTSGMNQDTEAKAEHWNWATQWSLPKQETLSLFVSGLFGYRMDTPQGMVHSPDSFLGGIYWGGMGRDAAWDDYFKRGNQGPSPGPTQYLRHTGGGNYAGVLVVLVAAWGLAMALRRKDSAFGVKHQKRIWFWAAAGIVSLLLAYGHHAPFYRILYALPYFSTIRNPTKFLQLVDFALVILFAYGVDGLNTRYLQAEAGQGVPLKAWWSKAGIFERRWLLGSAVALGVSMFAVFVYSHSRGALEQYLQKVQFDPTSAQAIAAFSIKQAAWFVVLLLLAVTLVAAIVSGRFVGKRTLWGAALLAALLVIDLGRANLPWIIYVDYKEKLESNEVIDFLAKQPYEHRVAIMPNWIIKAFRGAFAQPEQADRLAGLENYLENLYGIEWAQHLFLYYNIQSVDVIQMPRVPADLAAYDNAVMFTGRVDELHRVTRNWELTNTHYIIGASSLLPILNQGLDPGKGRFRIATNFTVEPKAEEAASDPNMGELEKMTARITNNGPFAVFEFTGALPRASLYSKWQVSTNDLATLKDIGSKEFDPAQTVLLASSLPSPATPARTNEAAGTVEYKSYDPKHIVLSAQAKQTSVLLLNDKYDPNWKVWVDGQPAQPLRCNFIMRGVEVPAGSHVVEWRFLPPVNALYVSIAVELLGVALLGLAIFEKPAEKPAPVRAQPAMATK
jgi:hypothetical protein